MMAKQSKAMQSFMKSRMHSFKQGTMHSAKARTGPVVRNRAQAIAIALSEARAKGMKGAGRPKRK